MSTISKMAHHKRRLKLLEETGKDIGPWVPPPKKEKKKKKR